MPIDYVTVFQISTQSPNWLFALAGGIPLIIGMVSLWGKRRFGWKQPHWLFAIFFCAFGLFWLCTAGVPVLREDSQMKTAFQTGNFEVVEGVVTDFHPMPYEGHQDECFSVQDPRFCYSDYGVTSGFHNATSHGGPIQAGLPVRIAYVGNNILRLEIPKDRILTPAQSATILNSAQQGWQQRTESDPFDRHMNVAFLFTAMCWTLWWNLQWKLAMRFWTRPPNRPWVQYLFRTFFALNFIGSLWKLAALLQAHPLAKQDIAPTIGIALLMCAVVALMTASVLWMILRHDARAKNNLLPQS